MKFEQPYVLFAFALLAIPVLIHLFHFRKYKTLYFSNIFFLKQVEEERKSIQKLKHLLILLSRLLLFSMLILAFAQPYSGEKTDNSNELTVFYIDNSMSMSLRGKEGELLAEAKERVKKALRNLSETAKVKLLTNALSGSEQRVLTKVEALEFVEKISYSPQTRTLQEVVYALENSENSKDLKQRLLLFSDFQRNTLSENGFPTNSSLEVFPIHLRPGVISNVYIDSVWFDAPNFRPRVTNTLSLRVQNSGAQERKNVEILLDIAGDKRSLFVDVAPNSSATLSLNYSDVKPGPKKVTLSLVDSEFKLDDEFFFVYQVKNEARVLIIDGDDAVSNIGKVFSLEPYFNFKSVSDKQVRNEDVAGVDLIVLNGLNSLSSGLANMLLNHHKNKGALAVFPGTKLESNSMNPFLKSIGLPSVLGVIEDGNKLKSLQLKDVFFDGVFEKKPEQLNVSLVKKVYRTSAAALSLITLQNNQGLLYRSASSNRSFLFASSLKEEFGSFTSNALFSTIVLRMGELSQRLAPLYLTIGKDAYYPIYASGQSEKPLRLKNEQFESIVKSELKDGQLLLSLFGIPTEQLRPGNYAVMQDDILSHLALNMDRTESQLNYLDVPVVIDRMQNEGKYAINTSFLNADATLEKITIDSAVEYWRIFVILAIFFALAEMALIKWWN